MSAKAHHLSECWPAIGIVRDSEQRREMFFQLAEQLADREDFDRDQLAIAEPEWLWYRINPCTPNCGEHSWHIGDGKQGRRGSFLGALINLIPKPAEVSS